MNWGVGQTIYTTNLKFSWKNASIDSLRQVKYSLYLDEDDSFSDTRIYAANFDTTIIIDSLAIDTTYYWKVLAKNNKGDSVWSSEIFKFSVNAD